MLAIIWMLFSWIAQPAFSQTNEALAERLDRLIEQHEGRTAITINHLETGVSYRRNADQPFPTASLVKVAVMIEAYRQAHDGVIDLDTFVTLSKEDKVPGSGILSQHFSDGARITIKDAIRLMIVYSDNTATNLVIDQIGLASIRDRMRQLGKKHTAIFAKVFRRETSIDTEASRRFGLGSTSADEMTELLSQMHRRTLISRQASDEMLGHLQKCEDRSKLLRFLPESLKAPHKSGAVNRVRTDAAILETETGPVVVCVLTAENEDSSWGDTNAAEILCGRIGKTVFDFFSASNASQPSGPKSLRVGATGDAVEDLQRTLNARIKPTPGISVDGDFGPRTESAVRTFQKQSGIETSGIVDAQTWEALGPLVTRQPAARTPDEVNSEELETLPADPLDGPPAVTCRAWAIADLKTGHLIDKDNASSKLDIASTTKIMTALVVLRLIDEKPERIKERITYSRRADRTNGSTSAIREGESVTCEECLYGLLLPSGNDASVALAEHFGRQLPIGKATDPYARFIEAMNATAGELGMKSTQFKNPHGLTASGHQSTAQDLILLGREIMKHPRFREVCSTRQFGCQAIGASGYRRNVVWENTNHLLEIDGYIGLKTGTTTAAGACLVSASRRDGREILVVVLGSKSSPARYSDSRNLHRWGWTRQLSQQRGKDRQPSP